MHGGGCHVGQTILCACMYMHAALPMSAPEFPERGGNDDII